MSNTPADTASRPPRRRQRRDDAPKMEARRDVLTPNLRAVAEHQGRDPEEVDPLAEDEDALRRANFGGRSALD